MRVFLSVLVSLAVHAVLAVVLFSRNENQGQTSFLTVTLDLASMEFSMAEKEDQSEQTADALSASASPTQASPQKPRQEDAPKSAEDDRRQSPPAPPVYRDPQPPERPAKLEPSAPAVAQAAPRQAKIDAPPRPRASIRPEYPREARQRGEEGRVVLELTIDEEGGCREAKVVNSSGFAELDAAAVKAARAARFEPAKAAGQPVGAVVRMTLVFKLR